MPLVDKSLIAGVQNRLLEFSYLAVVLGMEHVMHRGQTNVFVAATVTRDEVGVQQLVVVGVGQIIIDDLICIRIGNPASAWRRVVRDVVQKCVAGADGASRVDWRGRGARRKLRRRPGVRYDLRKASAGVGYKFAVLVGRQ